MSENKPRLKHFLLRHLEDPTYKEELQWVDRSKLIFRVLWMHAGRATFDRDRHQKLFYKYREYRGHKSSEDPKQCFGMALKKSPSVKPVENVSDDDWRYFIFTSGETRVDKTALQGNNNPRKTRAMSLCACPTHTAHTHCPATHHTLPCTAAHAPPRPHSATASPLASAYSHDHYSLNLPPSPPDHLDASHNPPHTPLSYCHPQDPQPLPDDLMDLDFASLRLIHSSSPQLVPLETTHPSNSLPCSSYEVPTLTYPPTPSGSSSPFSPYSLSSSSSPVPSFPHSSAEFSPEQSTAHWVS